MSYTLRVRCLSISCGTLEELDALVERYGRDDTEPVRRTEAAKIGSVDDEGSGSLETTPRRRVYRGDRATVSGPVGARSFPMAVVLGVFADGDALTGAQVADKLGAVGQIERTRVSATVSSLARTARIARATDGTSFEITAIGRERFRRIEAVNEEAQIEAEDRGAAGDEDDDDDEEAEEDDAAAAVDGPSGL